MPDRLKHQLAAAMSAAEPGAARVEPQLVAELALWAATADGELRRDEVDRLATLLRELPGLERFDADAAIAMVYSLAERYTTDAAIAGRVTEIAMTIATPESRRAAYRLAVWAAAHDGNVSEDEADFLGVLQDCLEIPDQEADVLMSAALWRK